MSPAFDQALALVHDALLHQQANGVKAAIPLESLRRLTEAVGPQSVRPTAGVRSEAPPRPALAQRPAPLAPSAAPEVGPPPSREPRTTRLVDQVRAHLPPEVVERSMPRQATPAEKAERMAALRERANDQLALSSSPLVFGTGSLNAEVIFIGDFPAPEDEAAGQPFRDEAGLMMGRIIQTMGLSMEEVYLVNLMQTRPETSSRRAFDPAEVALHLPYLVEQISIIAPRCLVGLGGGTVEALVRSGQPINRLRGNWQRYQGLPLMPTYHVAYLHSTQNPLHKRQVWTDMLQVLEKLERPISEKQRGYFQTVRG